MQNKSKKKKKSEDTFVEKETKHRKGRLCSKCFQRKDTEKIGELYICATCKEGKEIKRNSFVYVNSFQCWCGNIRPVETANTCESCGKMICGLCGNRCKDHLETK